MAKLDNGDYYFFSVKIANVTSTFLESKFKQILNFTKIVMVYRKNLNDYENRKYYHNLTNVFWFIAVDILRLFRNTDLYSNNGYHVASFLVNNYF